MALGGKLEISKLATYVEGLAICQTILGIELGTVNFQISTTIETLQSNFTGSLHQTYHRYKIVKLGRFTKVILPSSAFLCTC